ncbi:Guanyl-specific ribonuclease Sa3 precursor [Corynebacterium capitovis DSM 44611]|uniref:ribonuclease domain-containing protein n=1 Tax=Corynebacterium capitovis TaxID=131081 RepID=UPI0003754793|nr:Guanyl-specific ribonuclease Sa3 precursor [Corynebacterium capitovis DSM 44611]
MGQSNGLNNRYLGVILIALVALPLGEFGARVITTDDLSDAQVGPSTAPPAVSACASLPDEALSTIDLVEKGGPFPYPVEDDTRFGNYEGILPAEPSGYYREYTVSTPGLRSRGERRIVAGGGDDGQVDEWYYTADHYESFCEVAGR